MLARSTPICDASCLARGLAGTKPPTLVVEAADAGTAAAAGGDAGVAEGAADTEVGTSAGAATGAAEASATKSLKAAMLASSSTTTAIGVLMGTSCALRGRTE